MPLSKRAKIDAIADEIAAAAAHIDAGIHGLLRSIRSFDELRGWALQGASSCAHWLSWRLGMSLGAARQYVRVAHRLARLPRIADAMRRGELSYTKVRAMVRVATPENEELLMHQARGATGAQLERICAAFHRLPDQARPTDDERRYARKRTHRDGTMTLELRLMPDEVNELWLALTETRARLAPNMEERPSLADAALHWARSESLEGRGSAAAPTVQPSFDSTQSNDGTQLCHQADRRGGEGAVNHSAAWSETGEDEPRADVDDSAELREANDFDTERSNDGSAESPRTGDPAVAAGVGTSAGSSEDPGSPPGGSVVKGACSWCGATASPRAVQPLLYVHLRPEHIGPGEGHRLEAGKAARDNEDASPSAGAASRSEPWRAELHDGTPISGDALKRIACDCGLVAAKVDARGQPLDLGRRRRRISVPLMRALLLRDRQCRFPGCKHRGFLQAHHVEHWCDGGATDLDNLLLLCHGHHVAVHEGGFEVEVRNDGDGWYPEFRTPDGEVLDPAPERPSLDGDGLALLRGRNDADSEPILRPVPLWDGTPLDLEAAVNALANKTPPGDTARGSDAEDGTQTTSPGGSARERTRGGDQQPTTEA